MTAEKCEACHRNHKGNTYNGNPAGDTFNGTNFHRLYGSTCEMHSNEHPPVKSATFNSNGLETAKEVNCNNLVTDMLRGGREILKI